MPTSLMHINLFFYCIDKLFSVIFFQHSLEMVHIIVNITQRKFINLIDCVVIKDMQLLLGMQNLFHCWCWFMWWFFSLFIWKLIKFVKRLHAQLPSTSSALSLDRHLDRRSPLSCELANCGIAESMLRNLTVTFGLVTCYNVLGSPSLFATLVDSASIFRLLESSVKTSPSVAKACPSEVVTVCNGFRSSVRFSAWTSEFLTFFDDMNVALDP